MGGTYRGYADAPSSHLVNDGVEETPPLPTLGPVSEKLHEAPGLFVDLANANVGFQQWHPTAVTAHGNRLAGQGEAGGVWEWTSSPLAKHEGFEPMSLYPAYTGMYNPPFPSSPLELHPQRPYVLRCVGTADFFDGKHNIVLGGSWATHPRIAGRKSL